MQRSFGSWLLAVGRNKTASAESQRLKANSQSKKKESSVQIREICESGF